jgi:hypothetical protein
VKRRDALVSVAVYGAGAVMPSWSGVKIPSEGLSEEQLRILLWQLAGLDLQSGEAPKILVSLRSNRFTANVDPTVQPQSDFDPEVDV